jgi:hypothetical protein
MISAARRIFGLGDSFRRAASAYVSAMHWKELTTSSGPFSVKKLS